MKTNDLQAAMAAFLNNNPGLPGGKEIEDTRNQVKSVNGVRLHVSVEKKGRNGKIATIIDGLSVLEYDAVEELAKYIKKKLGTGGSCRGDEILIQGNVREKVVELLKEKGFLVR